MILTGTKKIKLFAGANKVKAAYIGAVKVYPNSSLAVTASLAFAAAGGSLVISIQVEDGQVWNVTGLPVGWAASATTGSGSASVTITASNNTTTGVKGGTITVISEDLSAGCAVSQAAGVIVYETPVVTAFGYPDIPASGGTVSPNQYAYQQAWTWNGVPGSGGVQTSGGTIYYSYNSGNVYADNLIGFQRGRTAIVDMTTRVDANGVTGQNANCIVCQAANEIFYHDQYFDIGHTSYNFGYTGGSQIFGVMPMQNVSYSSGFTSSVTTSREPSVTLSGSGFSLRKTTPGGGYIEYSYQVTASANNSYSYRSATTTISGSAPTKTIRFNQSGMPSPYVVVKNSGGQIINSVTVLSTLSNNSVTLTVQPINGSNWAMSVPSEARDILESLTCAGQSCMQPNTYNFSGSASLYIAAHRGGGVSRIFTLLLYVPGGNEQLYFEVTVQG